MLLLLYSSLVVVAQVVGCLLCGGTWQYKHRFNRWLVSRTGPVSHSTREKARHLCLSYSLTSPTHISLLQYAKNQPPGQHGFLVSHGREPTEMDRGPPADKALCASSSQTCLSLQLLITSRGSYDTAHYWSSPQINSTPYFLPFNNTQTEFCSGPPRPS